MNVMCVEPFYKSHKVMYNLYTCLYSIDKLILNSLIDVDKQNHRLTFYSLILIYIYILSTTSFGDLFSDCSCFKVSFFVVRTWSFFHTILIIYFQFLFPRIRISFIYLFKWPISLWNETVSWSCLSMPFYV